LQKDVGMGLFVGLYNSEWCISRRCALTRETRFQKYYMFY